MRTDQLALLFALVIAANLVLLIALQLPGLRRRRGSDAPRDEAGGVPREADEEPVSAIDRTISPLMPSAVVSSALYRRMTRVVSFVFIGSAMAIVALTGTPDATAIIVLLAFGLILIELFQDVLPSSALGRVRLPIEAAVLLILLTVLVAMTGGENSPYFFGYILVVGGAALSTSELAAALLAVISSGAYLGAVLIAANLAPLDAESVGIVAFNLVAIALVMFMASVIGREQRRAREAALALSRYDSMTGLMTTNYFATFVEQEIKRATRTPRPFGFILVDLDDLHVINHRFGLAGGDQAIKAVAESIRRTVRETDLIGRNSARADEFFVMLPETDISGAELVAENVRATVAEITLTRDGRKFQITASLGVVSFPQDGRSWDDIKSRANDAEEEAKRRGKNMVVSVRDLTPQTAGMQANRRRRDAQRSRDQGRRRRTEMPQATSGPAPWETA